MRASRQSYVELSASKAIDDFRFAEKSGLTIEHFDVEEGFDTGQVFAAVRLLRDWSNDVSGRKSVGIDAVPSSDVDSAFAVKGLRHHEQAVLTKNVLGAQDGIESGEP